MIIKSKCGKHDIHIDKEDHQKVMDFAPNGWEVRFFTKSNNPYAITRKTIDVDGKRVRKQFYMHRLVMDVLNATIPHVDHKFNNSLDNRKNCLRLVTRYQNMKNRTSAKESTSKHLGVSYCKSKRGTKKYRTCIKDGKKHPHNIHLGYYYDEESAGYAYNFAAEVIHKEYANLNKININEVDNPDGIREYIEKALKKYDFN